MKLAAIIGSALLFVAGVTCAAWVLTPRYYGGVRHAGEFGDMFGSANAVFSGVALIGVIVAIALQTRELGLQRDELEATREELKGQKVQLQAQNETLRRQADENTFFHLLRLQAEAVGSIEVLASGRQLRGRKCFAFFYNELHKEYGEERWRNLNDEARFSGAYEAVYERYQTDLGHYFRTLYNIFKSVDRSAGFASPRTYSALARAQLSNQELLLLFYNCLSHLGHEKFRPLVIKYALLNNMPKAQLLNKEHADLYPQEAYGEGASD